jgi:uncharacterized protein (TIGR03792 family)
MLRCCSLNGEKVPALTPRHRRQGGWHASRSVIGGSCLEPKKRMLIEILHFVVEPGRLDEFIDRNEQVWTPALRGQQGFLRREVLVSDDRADEVVILVYWTKRAALEAFPKERQARLEARMADLIRHQTQHSYERILPHDGIPSTESS